MKYVLATTLALLSLNAIAAKIQHINCEVFIKSANHERFTKTTGISSGQLSLTLKNKGYTELHFYSASTLDDFSPSAGNNNDDILSLDLSAKMISKREMDVSFSQHNIIKNQDNKVERAKLVMSLNMNGEKRFFQGRRAFKKEMAIDLLNSIPECSLE